MAQHGVGVPTEVEPEGRSGIVEGIVMARPRKAAVAPQAQGDDTITKRWASLTWEDVNSWAGSRSASRGRTYQRQGRVADLAVTEDGKLLATVMGTVCDFRVVGRQERPVPQD